MNRILKIGGECLDKKFVLRTTNGIMSELDKEAHSESVNMLINKILLDWVVNNRNKRNEGEKSK